MIAAVFNGSRSLGWFDTTLDLPHFLRLEGEGANLIAVFGIEPHPDFKPVWILTGGNGPDGTLVRPFQNA